MIKGIYHSAHGMLAGQRHLEVVANNLANASTIGFKDAQITFKNALNRSTFPDYPVTAGESYVEAERGGNANSRQGTLRQTDNPLHAAIVGDGFFAVDTGNGLAYTRDGRFELNSQGELVTLSGQRILTAGGFLQIPEGNLHLSAQGDLILTGSDQAQDNILDRLMVVTFEQPQKLERAGHGLLVTDQEPVQIEEPSLRIGYLEESTVNVVSEMVEMIELNRLYEASAKAIQTQDSTLGKTVNEVGRVK
jgi:flagellar basal-body rod protein FlgG